MKVNVHFIYLSFLLILILMVRPVTDLVLGPEDAKKNSNFLVLRRHIVWSGRQSHSGGRDGALFSWEDGQRDRLP